jgi:hypothetical protein
MLTAGGRACAHCQSARPYSSSAASRMAFSVGSSRSKYDWQKSAPAKSSALSMVDSSTFSNRRPVFMSRKW